MEQLNLFEQNGIKIETQQESIRITNKNIIKNVSYDQKEILYNIMLLHNDMKPFDCDMTASELNFYKRTNDSPYKIPMPKILFDVFPKSDFIKKIEPNGDLPLENESINSIVIDLPFIIDSNINSIIKGIILKRFHAYYPAIELYKNYYHWIKEAMRVLKKNGICVFKCQSVVSSGIKHNIEEYSCLCAYNVGFAVEDRFTLLSKNRLIGNNHANQKHARSFTSVFYVFKKSESNKYQQFNFMRLINDIF